MKNNQTDLKPSRIEHEDRQKLGRTLLQKILSEIRPGMSEREGFDLVQQTFHDHHIQKLWHPSVVKFDENSLLPGVKHSPSPEKRLVNMALVDLGPIIDGLEVDIGESLGFCEDSKTLALTSQKIFEEVKKEILSRPHFYSPSQIYFMIKEKSEAYHYQFLAPTAGHTLGRFPNSKKETKIRPDDPEKQLKAGGWMLEVHIGNGQYGAFYEDFLFIED